MKKANENDGLNLECPLMYSIKNIPGIQLNQYASYEVVMKILVQNGFREIFYSD